MSAINSNRCYFIAELSCNHNGNYQEAVKLIELAAQAGADAVKVQTYTPDTITRNFKTSLPGTLWEAQDLYSLYQKSHMPWQWQPKLKRIAENFKLDFLSSPFDETAVDFLVDQVKVSAIKVASFEGVDLKLLQKIGRTGIPVILSNGMMDFLELQEAVNTLRVSGAQDLTLLHCNSGYPTSFAEVNLMTLPVMQKIFSTPVGISDHTLFRNVKAYSDPLPTIVPLEAVKLGATMVEVHLLEDRESSRRLMEQNLGGFDWPFSRTPSEFKLMVDTIRELEKSGFHEYALANETNAATEVRGTVNFMPTPGELSSRAGRPSLWVVRDVAKGEPLKFAAEQLSKKDGNFDSIRPAGGLHIRFADCVQGSRAARELHAGEPLTWEMICFDV